jgi:hypothetical protein
VNFYEFLSLKAQERKHELLGVNGVLWTRVYRSREVTGFITVVLLAQNSLQVVTKISDLIVL